MAAIPFPWTSKNDKETTASKDNVDEFLSKINELTEKIKNLEVENKSLRELCQARKASNEEKQDKDDVFTNPVPKPETDQKTTPIKKDSATENPLNPKASCKPEKNVEQAADNEVPQDAKPETRPNDDAIRQIFDELKKVSEQMSFQLSFNNQVRNDLRQALEKRNEWADKYDKLFQNVQEDRYRKDKVKLINKIIFWADLLRRVLYDFNVKREQENRGEKNDETIFLEKQINAIISGFDDALKHEMVFTRPMASRGDAIDDEFMEVVEIEETSEPDLDGKVARSISAGYYWTLPYVLKARVNESDEEIRSYRFVLHPEEVVMFKLKRDA